MNEETTDNHRRSTVNLSRTAKITPRQENVMVARLQISCTATTFASHFKSSSISNIQTNGNVDLIFKFLNNYRKSKALVTVRSVFSNHKEKNKKQKF